MRKIVRKLIEKLPLCLFVAKYRNIQRFRVLSANEKRCVEFYRQFVKPADLVFDVGANMGSRTKVFLNLGARVVAFEPQKACSNFLRLALKGNDNFTLIEAALGAKDGEAEMLISSMNSISTLSPQWVKATKESGRFSRQNWNAKERVHVTTLDNAIQEFGTPSFVKIDVEGYEYEVLSGMTHPLRCISIEFAAENIVNTCKCIDYLSSLSNVLFQFSADESMKLYFPEWVSKKEIKRSLVEMSDLDELAWGDVYIKDIRTDDWARCLGE